MSKHYSPEDADLPVVVTVADYYEGIRQAQAEAWGQGALAQAASYGMDKDTGPNPYEAGER